MLKLTECVHVIEDREACHVSDDDGIEFFNVWICDKCGEEFPADELVRFLKAGSRTIH